MHDVQECTTRSLKVADAWLLVQALTLYGSLCSNTSKGFPTLTTGACTTVAVLHAIALDASLYSATLLSENPKL